MGEGTDNREQRSGRSRKNPKLLQGEVTQAPLDGGLTTDQVKKIKSMRRIRRFVLLAIAEVLILSAMFIYRYFLRQWNRIQRPEFSEMEIKNNDLDMNTIETMKGYWTIAVFGVDARDKSLVKGTNSDVNIICNVNMDTGEIKLVSVYRDTYLNVSKSGIYSKINQAYFMGGPEQAVAALNRNLDLDISDYMTFNWKAVADAINILGGVDVEISNAEFRYINSFITETVNVTGIGSHQLQSAGMNHLDGVQAVAYGRLRLMDSDYARTERQRKIIQLAFDKAKKADFDTLNTILGAVFPQVATSINVNDIFNALKIINRYHIGETTGFPQARGDARMGSKGACVIPQTLESNVIKLHEFLYGDTEYTPSSTVKNIGAKISADTGMYREGTYVESVGTAGSLGNSSRQASSKGDSEDEGADTSGRSNAQESLSEKKYVTIYVLDAEGNRVKRTVLARTDSSGDVVEPETDASGISTEYRLDEDGDLVRIASKTAGNGEDEEAGEEASAGILSPGKSLAGDEQADEDEDTDEDDPETTASISPTAPTSSSYKKGQTETAETEAVSPTAASGRTSQTTTAQTETTSVTPTAASGRTGQTTAAQTETTSAASTTAGASETLAPVRSSATAADPGNTKLSGKNSTSGISNGPGSDASSSTVTSGPGN